MTAYVQAAHYRPGRLGGVDLLVVHSTESTGSAEQTAAYFHTTTRAASAHSIVDDDSRVDCVRFTDTAYAAPGANADGEHLEVCGFASWSAADWMRHPGRLEQAARWLAERAKARSIPLTYLTPVQLQADRRGVTTHRNVSLAFHRSTHTDPGLGFPLASVLVRARQLLAPTVAPVTATRTVPPFPGVLRVGSTGQGVVALQRRLRARGWTIGVDGRYGAGTASVVAAFQREKKLGVDGVVGPVTWRAVFLARVT